MQESTEKKERIGIYGGSFNPIHFGHIHLAIEMLEKRALDKIYFCPAALNPHKIESKNMIAPAHRLTMLKLALEEIPQFSVIENELQRPAPSFTIDTVEELLLTDPQPHYFFIAGNDVVATFDHWHRAHEIVALVDVLIGTRLVDFENFHTRMNLDPVIDEALKAGITPTRVFEVSSTEIRERIARKKYCGHLVPSKVLDYIYRNRLYFSYFS